MTEPLALVACGAVTPVGFSAPSTCAAVRGHISAFSESGLFHESFVDVRPPVLNAIVEARVPNLTPEDPEDEFERLVRFATLSIRECLAGSGAEPGQTPLMLGVREGYREHPLLSQLGADWLRAIEAELGVRFHRASQVIPAGHASVFQGILAARQLLIDRVVTTCIVGGVDSYLNVYDLERFVSTYRILGPAVSRGFVPGEGAACVALRREPWESASGHDVFVLGVGLAAEDPRSIALSDGHATGRGLERALDAAVLDGGVPGKLDRSPNL